MENFAFVECTISGDGRSHHVAGGRQIENLVMRACEEIPRATVMVQRSRRDDVIGVHPFVTFTDDLEGVITVAVQPVRLGGPRGFTDAHAEPPVTTVTAGEPFWISDDHDYAVLRLRTLRFSQAYSDSLLTSAQVYVTALADFVRAELWPADGVTKAVNAKFERLG